MVGAASESTIILRRQRSSISEAPSTVLRTVPLPHFRGGGCAPPFSRCVCASEVCHATARKPFGLPIKEGRRSAERRAVRGRIDGCGARHAGECCHSPALRARSPFGAPPRRSPGRTHPPLAQLQYRASWDEAATGVTLCRQSPVNRAPRRPVVVPVGRGPRAARAQFARPRAGTALAPPSRSHPECALR